MADLQQFSITRIANANLNVPRWRVEVRIVNDAGQITHDFTGANALTFPTVLGQLTNEQQDKVVAFVMQELILRRTGMKTR